MLDSAITAITPRGPAYRGRLAVELAARGVGFEAVAELLWSGALPDEPVAWPRATMPVAQLARLAAGAHPLDAMRARARALDGLAARPSATERRRAAAR